MRGRLRAILIKAALFTYNGFIFVFLNIVMWRNHLWNKKRWTKIRPAEDELEAAEA